MFREAKPILCYVTNRRSLSRPDPAAAHGDAADALLKVIRHVAAARVDWIQIREKDLPARELLMLARRGIAAASEDGVRVVINDRLDVAVAAQAAGVHLGEESLPVEAVTRWRQSTGKSRADFFMGVSCHSLAAAVEAARAGADYVFFGPVFATPSKEAYGPPQGLERLGEVTRSVSVPVLAIGGVTLENAAECLRVGAAGVAAIRMFQQAADLAAAVERLRAHLR